MAKYLEQSGGALVERAAPTTSAGAASAGLLPALDASGRLDTSFMPTGIGADTATITASEALAAGDFVNIYNNAGAAAVRKADGAVSGRPAHGFVIAAVASGAAATVYFEGTNGAVTGQTPGPVYLSDVAAGRTITTPPTGAGKVVQNLGVATSATSINVEPHLPIALA